MLVLSRYPGEVIRVGEDVSIVVVEISGGRVRLGIEAPADVVVDRQEVYEAKREEKASQP